MIDKIINELTPRFKGLDLMFSKSEDSFVSTCHSQLSGGIGMKIRNEYNLWDDESEEHKYFKSIGLNHADEMSDYILRQLHKKVNNDRNLSQ